MASLSEIYVKKTTLETILKALNAKQGKEGEGVKITISLSDQTNNFGQNVSAYVAQTKEQREAKTPLFYVGNGKTFWSKGETPVPQREQPTQAPKPVTSANDDEPLPF
jgi:crotonobetainyl-CoA:carnitine CoA-transferase CaiB-like acyl-CoA transferase